MANYDLMVDSTFTPFSFQDIAAPYLMYKQEYDKRLEDLGALDEAASIWDGLTDAEKDPIAHAKYTAYINALQQAADGLAREGLNGLSKSHLIALKGNYNKRIKPIETAFLKRAQQIEAQAKAGNSQLNSYDAANTSLDDYLLDPTLQYKSIDLNKLGQEAAAYMGVISKQITDYSLTKDPKIADNMKKLFTKQLGYTEAQANQLMSAISSGNVDTNTIVGNIAQRLYNETGVSDNNIWNDDARSSVWNTIAKGAIATMGGKDLQLVDDEEAKMAAQWEFEKRKIWYSVGARNEEEYRAIMNSQSSNYANIDVLPYDLGVDPDYKDLKNGISLIYYDEDGEPQFNKDIFGENGNVNAMKLYEEAHKKDHGIYAKEYKEFQKQAEKQLSESGELYNSEALTPAELHGGINREYRSPLTKINELAQKMWLAKHGVTKMLSAGEYAAMRKAGMRSWKQSDGEFDGVMYYAKTPQNLLNAINTSVKSNSLYSLNFTDTSSLHTKLNAGLSAKLNNKAERKNTARILKPNTTAYKTIDLDKLYDDKNQLRKIDAAYIANPSEYNGLKPGDFIVKFNGLDDLIVLNVNNINKETAQAFKLATAQKDKFNSPDEYLRTLGTIMVQDVNSQNQILPKTNAKVGE